MTFDILGIRLTCSNLFYVRVMKEEAAWVMDIATLTSNTFLARLFATSSFHPSPRSRSVSRAALLSCMHHRFCSSNNKQKARVYAETYLQEEERVGSRSPRISSLIHKCLIIKHASIV